MINIDKIRQECHGWVDQTIGSSNSSSSIAHGALDAFFDSVEYRLSGDPEPETSRPEKPPLWTPSDSGTPDAVDLYQNDPHMLMLASLLEQRDTLDMRATMAEEVAGSLKAELDQAKSARAEETQRADEANRHAAELQAMVDQLERIAGNIGTGPTYTELRAKLTETEHILDDARVQQAADVAELNVLRPIREAARVYLREFGHLVANGPYPEQQDLHNVLNNAEHYYR